LIDIILYTITSEGQLKENLPADMRLVLVLVMDACLPAGRLAHL